MSKIWKLYRNQERQANLRGISFEITFEEWISWWEQQLGPDWLQRRGSRVGQYVMARFNDKGPYKLGNIQCITCSQNVSEREITPERRARMSDAHKGHVPSAEARAKLSAALKGRRQTPEHRAKVSAALKGHKLSAKTRAKISATKKAKRQRHTAEWRAKRSAAMKGNQYSRGHRHSPETRAKLSAAVRSHYHNLSA